MSKDTFYGVEFIEDAYYLINITGFNESCFCVAKLVKHKGLFILREEQILQDLSSYKINYIQLLTK